MSNIQHRGNLRNDPAVLAGLPLFDFATRDIGDPIALTPGGLVVFRRTHRPISTCNAIAELAGLICREVEHA